VNGTAVTNLLPGTHHCLVAQIAYDDAPIVAPPGQTISPFGGTDKLAQRNLQITPAFNPGKPPTNRVPQTFDVRPSALTMASQPDFDELMIDWGNTPVGSTASIYWPGASAAQVLKLADARYAYHNLTAADAHTIQTSVVKGLTYVPIPPQTGANLASLLTVELPSHVKAGQSSAVIVRRVTTRVPPPVEIQSRARNSPAVSPPTERQKQPGGGARPTREAPAAPRAWRNITGAFQVNIPVQTDKELLPYDENTMAIFKWRLEVMPSTNRWHPVLKR
jgi:hypothetical protein